MKVATVQKTLGDLVDLLAATGIPKRVIDGIRRTRLALEPFHDRELRDPADPFTQTQQAETKGHRNGTSSDDVSVLANRMMELQGEPGFESQLKAVKKLAVPKLKELAKLLSVNSAGATKPDLIEAIYSRFNASKTAATVQKLAYLKSRADAVNSDVAQVEHEIEECLRGFDEDELVRIAAGFDVILAGKKTRKKTLEEIRRKVLATPIAKRMIAY